MCPVTGLDAEARYPVHQLAAGRAWEDEPLELALQTCLHLEQFQPQHLHVDRDGVRPTEPGLDRLIDDGIRGRRLLGNCRD